MSHPIFLTLIIVPPRLHPSSTNLSPDTTLSSSSSSSPSPSPSHIHMNEPSNANGCSNDFVKIDIVVERNHIAERCQSKPRDHIAVDEGIRGEEREPKMRK